MNNIPIENDEVSLKELIQKGKDWLVYLVSQWKIIALCSVFGALLGLTYSVVKKPLYIATLSFALEDEKSGSGLGALGLASSLGLDLGGSGGGSMFSGPNLTELIKSRSIVQKTLLTSVNVKGKEISLAEFYIQNNEWRKRWEGNPKFASMKFLPNANRKLFTRDQDSIMGILFDEISNSGLAVAQKDKKISIINIDISSTNELFAKYFCEALAQQVSDFYISIKSKKARMNMAILERQSDSIRGELNGAITGVAIATDNIFNLNPALNVKRSPSTRRQVDVQANTEILTELVKQTELAKVTLRKETPLIQIIDSPILPLKKDKLGKVKGFLIGFFLFGFISVLFLMGKKYLKEILIS